MSMVSENLRAIRCCPAPFLLLDQIGCGFGDLISEGHEPIVILAELLFRLVEIHAQLLQVLGLEEAFDHGKDHIVLLPNVIRVELADCSNIGDQLFSRCSAISCICLYRIVERRDQLSSLLVFRSKRTKWASGFRNPAALHSREQDCFFLSVVTHIGKLSEEPACPAQQFHIHWAVALDLLTQNVQGTDHFQ